MLVAILAATGLAGIVLLPLLGARLLPDFRENYLIAHASLRAGISLTETSRVGLEISKGLLAIPGVKSVAEQIGRAENGQDPDAPNKSEFEVQIDPKHGHNAAEIDAAIRDVFDDFPNQLVEIYSVLAERIGETLSGESAPFTISVIGSDLDADDRVGAQIVDVLQHLPDSGNVRLTVPPRELELRIELLPDRLAVYGLQAADVLQTVNAAYHGTAAAELAQADRSVPVAVRIADAGADPRALGALVLRGRDGALVPLSSVAKITTELARSLIDHQDGLRRQIVVATPKGADQAGFADAARKAVAQVPLPPGVFLRYGGAAEAQAAAGARAAAAFGRRVRADRAAARAGLCVLAARAAGAACLAEHAHRRRGGGCDHRRHPHLGGHGGIRRAVRHGGAQHDPADIALRPPGGRRRRGLESQHRDARGGGAADAGIAHRAAHRAGAAAGGAAAASARTRDRGPDGGRNTRRAGILYTGQLCC